MELPTMVESVGSVKGAKATIKVFDQMFALPGLHSYRSVEAPGVHSGHLRKMNQLFNR